MAFNDDEKARIFSVPGLVGSGNATSATAAGSWNSDTNGITIVTAPSDGVVITSIFASTDEAADKDIFVYILDGAEVLPLGRVTILDGAGTDGTEGMVDVLASISGTTADADGNSILELKGGALLKYSLQAALTASDVMEVSAMGRIVNS